MVSPFTQSTFRNSDIWQLLFYLSCFCQPALKDTLQTRGVLGSIKAKIRAEVYHALDEVNELQSHHICDDTRPFHDQEAAPQSIISNENLLINELIREYLEFNKYQHSLSVFMPGRDRRYVWNPLIYCYRNRPAYFETLWPEFFSSRVAWLGFVVAASFVWQCILQLIQKYKASPQSRFYTAL